jgi:glycosyltransferase AglE
MVSEHPYVSVIIPVRNATVFLDEIMKGVRRQTYPKGRFEVLFVDNGSEDDTSERLDKKGFRVLSRPFPNTPYAARNTGLEQAKGTIIAFTDANKIPDPDWLEAGVNCLMQSGADLAGGEIRFSISRESSTAEIADAILFNNNRELVASEGGATTGNLFVRRDVIDQMGPFPEQFRSGMDMYWTRRAAEHGFRITFCESAVVRCKPRALRPLLKKSYRVGKVHPHNMKAGGKSSGTILKRTLATFLPPRRREIRERLEPVIMDVNYRFAELWLVIWQVRIFMGMGRLRGLIDGFAESLSEEDS